MNEMKGMFSRIINNKIRMGNFETIEEDLIGLRNLLNYPERPFSIADLCAGSGRALEKLAEGSSAVTFGIEPNENKYVELRDRATHALFGGYEECRLTRNFYNLLYLNPPYDADSDQEGESERKEKRFLRHLLPALSIGGVLIYNIPLYRLEKSIASILAANLENIRLYQSHDSTFKQVYIIGRRRKSIFIDTDEAKRLIAIRDGEIPLVKLPDEYTPLYQVYEGNVRPKLFRSSRADVDQLRKICLSSQLVQRSMQLCSPKRPAAKLQPLLPDKEMHRVLRMASGKLNGRVGQGEFIHVLKGIVKKVASIGEPDETDHEIVQTETETFKITFKLVDRNGNIKVIHG
ncbi:DUF6094 domain-containing protein [Paenibacillus enshidis]|uniref:DUF6094 domain-containing protein n=1 Tax=Paenibacillus enshidis TaxID=1458439 RepID=A0ABV5AVI4_9BACL